MLFTAHYLMLRGFYALEQNRRVFWIQCAIAATNIVAAVLLTRDAPPLGDRAAAGDRLRAAPTPSGRRLSYVLLSRDGRRPRRSPAGALPGPAGDRGRDQRRRRVGTARGDGQLVPDEGKLHAVLDLVVVGLAFLAIYLGLARLLRISEVD